MAAKKKEEKKGYNVLQFYLSSTPRHSKFSNSIDIEL
jgi:hypothetical protein